MNLLKTQKVLLGPKEGEEDSDLNKFLKQSSISREFLRKARSGVRGAKLNLSRRLLILFIYQIYNTSACTCLRHGLNIPAQKKGQLERAEYLLEHTHKNTT